MLFQGQWRFDHGNVDVAMTLPEEGGVCSFCESTIPEVLLEQEVSCLRCARSVCGKCGVRQYLSTGDYIICLECVH